MTILEDIFSTLLLQLYHFATQQKNVLFWVIYDVKKKTPAVLVWALQVDTSSFFPGIHVSVEPAVFNTEVGHRQGNR